MNPKRYLIVGGTSGIGRSVAMSLLRSGHEVLVISRGQSPAVFDEFQPEWFQADVTDTTASLPEIKDQLDGIVYCPGSINLKPLKMLREDDFLADFRVNVLGAFRTIKNYLPALQLSSLGSVVLFSTVAVQQGMPFHSSVASAKGAVEGLTRSLAAELAPKVRVNAIAPSLTKTPLASKLLGSAEKTAAAEARHPMKHVGDPDDIASLVIWLLDDQSRWMTGQIIAFDGGMSSLKA